MSSNHFTASQILDIAIRTTSDNLGEYLLALSESEPERADEIQTRVRLAVERGFLVADVRTGEFLLTGKGEVLVAA